MAGWTTLSIIWTCFVLAVVNGRPNVVEFAPPEPQCGYRSCPATSDTMLNVHLVPHTHDDVGWLKTVDQYFYGSRNDIQHAGVQYILDSVIPELLSDPSKRFIYVEIAFFARWWREQDATMKGNVRKLVSEGRLEFVLGGWCMNDEASTHYNAMIDQHTLGFSFLEEEFGDCGRPRVGWQIDPFGHSREQASMFAQFGFDGLFFGRLDYQDKDTRVKQNNMEFVWRGSPKNLGKTSELFTGVLYNHYVPPPGFCFDELCNDEPIMDDERMHDVNIQSRVQDFIKVVKDQAQHFHSNNIMMTMGSDFQYSNAHTWYKNLDKLIKYVNQQQSNGSDINLLYSTPSCYLYNLNHLNQVWNSTKDDFFPYASRENTFWSGYFSSRAALKGYARKSNNFLQVCKQLDVLADLRRQGMFATENLRVFKEALGVVQHHDGISGTEKQHVADDYAQRLAVGAERCQLVTNAAFEKLLPKGSESAPKQVYCSLTNISYCDFTEHQKQFMMTVYNPLGHLITDFVRIPVAGGPYRVVDPKGFNVTAQLVQVTNETKRIPERNKSIATNELVFMVEVPPLGYSTYFIVETNNMDEATSQSSKTVSLPRDQSEIPLYIDNDEYLVNLDNINSNTLGLTNKRKNISIPLNQAIWWYEAHGGNCSKGEFQASGAYALRTKGERHRLQDDTSVYLTTGELVQEAHMNFGPEATEVIRLYKNMPFVEVEWTVGPINIKDKLGKEYITLYDTQSMASGDLFYTDANGREILERQRDHRNTWNFNNTEHVAGNYYPVNSRIFIQDKNQNQQLTVLTDRSEGGSSLESGSLELLVHRRLLYDDHFGVGEPLNETGADGQGLIVRGKHLMILDTIKDSPALHRSLALKSYMAPSVSFSELTMTPEQAMTKYNTQWSALKKPLPANVHMLTLEQWTDTPKIEPIEVPQILIRFEHIYEIDEDPVLSQPAVVDLTDFTTFKIVTMKELTLGANLPLAELNRLPWAYIPDTKEELLTKEKLLNTAISSSASTISLQPMQIRTFVATLDKMH
ncbi:lysosomal alpha-mannosidase-like [Saccostrea echinata]|uniref:lysosomal alpha-mannosidase-like n=1 Tax=Saccostrea echinata TaxID=191078 RepID=UPI002A7F67EB|nr:lysosomal alpha-mannosidase-like [Saccostrea echinata]